MTIDRVPAGYATLDEALMRLAAHVAEQDVLLKKNQRRLRSAFGFLPEETDDDRDALGAWPPNLGDDRGDLDAEKLHKTLRQGTLAWAKRQLAVWKLHEALGKGALASFVRDASGEMFRITPADWRAAVLARETIIGGVVRASAGELIERYAGRCVLIETAALDRLLREEKESRPQTASNDCLSWLMTAMRANPDKPPKTKAQYYVEADEQFGIGSKREFDRLWAQAKRNTGARWRAGRPKKSLQ